ncbi:anti-sigma factor family protein [Promicromonospora soli]
MPQSTGSLPGCRQVARDLQAYLDGELDADRARPVAEHLADCRRCGLEASTYEAIRVALAAIRARSGPVADDAVERLRAFADRLAEARP